MSIKEMAISILDSLPEDKLLAFVNLFADENMLARLETETLANNPNAPKYATVDDLFRELEN